MNMDEFGNVKHLTQTFDNSNDYQIDLMREIYSKYEKIDISNLDSGVINYNLSYPWENSDTKLSKDDLEKRDKWQSLLMPSGAIVAARVDTSHWLTFGTENTMPVLYSNFPILMTGSNSQAILRIGELTPNEKVTENRVINWSHIPSGFDMNVKMSGLVWPEASQRIANSAYLTREKVGKGQIILFSGEPNFRGAARGTNRLWLNAVIYGSGLGTDPIVNP